MLRDNLNLNTPYGPILGTSPAVQGALPCSMQLSHKQYVEEINNALFEVDGSIAWVLACILIQLLCRLKIFLYLCIDRKNLKEGKF